MLTTYRYCQTRREFQWIPADRFAEFADDLRRPDAATWIDLENPTEAEEHLVFGQFLPVHSLTLEDITRPRNDPRGRPHLPKVEEFADYLFVVANPLRVTKIDEVVRGTFTGQLSAIITDRLLITHHAGPLTSVSEVRTYLERHGDQGQRGPDYVFHLILDAMVDEFAPLLDGLADELEAAEARLFLRDGPVALTRLLHLKRSIAELRKTLVYEREVLARLSRGEFELIDERETAYYRNVYDHLIRFTELTESGREMVSDLLQTYLAVTSNRMNEVMKALTAMSTVVLPMTLIAGIYGMNFDMMPELRWPWGYPLALILMAVAGALPWSLFKWKGWV